MLRPVCWCAMVETRTIQLGADRSLNAVTSGVGPDVLMLHGALATSHDWRAWEIDRLVKSGLMVTTLDRPGHGLIRRPRLAGTPRAQAK